MSTSMRAPTLGQINWGYLSNPMSITCGLVTDTLILVGLSLPICTLGG